jgi:hypothetical protein
MHPFAAVRHVEEELCVPVAGADDNYTIVAGLERGVLGSTVGIRRHCRDMVRAAQVETGLRLLDRLVSIIIFNRHQNRLTHATGRTIDALDNS